MAPPGDPALGIRTRAVRDGDDYLLSGNKVAFVSNGGVAKAYFVFARVAFDRPAAETVSIFCVPAARRGLSIGSRADLLGLRSAWTGYSCDFTGDMLRLGIADAL